MLKKVLAIVLFVTMAVDCFAATNPLAIPQGGTGATTAPGAALNLSVLPHVSNLAALKASSVVAPTVVRDGYTSAGDGGAGVYNYSSSPCSIGSGAGDNGSQVIASDGKCWLLDAGQRPVDVRVWGAQITSAGGYRASILDPAGQFDNTAALNAACASKAALYITTGRYHTKDLWHCSTSWINGDGPDNSVIDVGTDFNMSAIAVINLIDASVGQNATHIVGLGVQEYQNPSISYTSTADLIHYPPVYTATGGGRAVLEDIEIGRCYDGIYVNSNNIINMTGIIQIGCFHQPIYYAGQLDWSFWDSVELWPFGNNGNANFSALYALGTATSFLGRSDGLHVNTLASFQNAINVDDGATGVGYNIERLQFDAGGGMTVTNGRVRIGQFMNDAGSIGPAALTLQTVHYDTTIVTIDFCAICSSALSTGTFINHGGQLIINGGYYGWNGDIGPAFVVDDTVGPSRTYIRGATIHGDSFTGPSNPFLIETGSNVGVVIDGLQNENSPAPTAPFLQLVDKSGNSIQNMSWNRGYNIPVTLTLASPVLGYYDMPTTRFTITANPQFTTMGDFVPANTTTVGSYQLLGNHVDFTLGETFDVNAYTTASGSFQISTNLPYGNVTTDGGDWAMSIGTLSKVTFAANTMIFGQVRNTTPVLLQFTTATSGTAWGQLNTTNIPASTTAVYMKVTGSYPIK